MAVQVLVWIVRGSFACALALALVAGGVLALQLDREVESLRSEVAGVRGDVKRLGRRHQTAAARVRVLRRELQVVSHPLRSALSWPVRGPVLDEFGSRGGAHAGIDVDAPSGYSIRAAAPGVVVAAGPYHGYGNRIVVSHGRGLTTVYAHLSAIAVGPGALVSEETALGSVGCTGSCTDAHLHFEVRLRGEPTDPLAWLPSGDVRSTAQFVG